MTTEQQNRLWACLPQRSRRKASATYFLPKDLSNEISEYSRGYIAALIHLFGSHNLTSETEPAEMLCISRKKVQHIFSRCNYKNWSNNAEETYAAHLICDLLDSLFGDKCLPDKELNEDYFAKSDTPDSFNLANIGKEEQVNPKFKVGDKIRVKEYTVNTNNSDSLAFLSGQVFTIKYVGADGYGKFVYTVMEMASPIHESYLEPYTEEKGNNTEKSGKIQKIPNPSQIPPENCDNKNRISNSDNMEEEALNLCELLKGCEGEPLYSRAFGEVTMNEIVRDDRPCAYEIKVYTPDPQSDRIWFYRDGRAYRNGQIDLYPSRALYEKYPLDAAKAWAEWAESRKPKRWRAKKYQGYYHLDCIGGRLVTLYDTDEYDKDENNRYESYNYFCTKELAEQAAEEVRKTLQKFHERKEGER